MTNARCLFLVDSEALIVANTGQPFDRTQVCSIAEARLSTKRERRKIIVPKEDEIPSVKLIQYIRENNVKLYLSHHNRLTEDCEAENSLMLDYGGRGLLELLQNADDAMAPAHTELRKQIGEKGVGFKSVLEFTNEPEIHSGPFHFRFSAAATAVILQSRLEHFQPEQHKLVFRIPHDHAPSKEIAELLKEYDTVIRLPFKDEISRKQVTQWLSAFDERILLFCHRIKELRIQRFEQHRLLRIERSTEDHSDRDVVLLEQNGEQVPSRTEYRVWSDYIDQGEGKNYYFAEIALPLDSSSQPVPIEKPTVLYKFFPTEEGVPLRCIVNAAFSLTDNRNHVRKGFEKEKEIVTLFQRLAGRVTASSLDPRVIIKSFTSDEDISGDNGVGGWISGIFHQCLSETEIIPCLGGKNKKPGDVCIWEEQYELSAIMDHEWEQLSEKRFVTLDIVQDQICARLLIDRFGAEQFDRNDLPDLLLHVCNHTLEACIKVIRILRLLPGYILNECQGVACWWTRRKKARSSAGSIPLYRNSIRLPKWIDADFLHPRLDQEIEGENANDSGWRQFINKVIPPADWEQLFHRSLLPSIAKHDDAGWWKCNGPEVLVLYEKWCPAKETFEKMTPLFLGDVPSHYDEFVLRAKAACALRLPTDKGWLPASQCYAGTDWGGDRSITAYFRKVPDRGVLKPSKRWPVPISNKDYERWRLVLKFAGVSWEPKIVHFTHNTGISFRKYPVYPWGEPVPSSWNDYVKTLKPATFRNRSHFEHSPSQTDQWQIEHIPDCLPRDAHAAIKLMRPLLKLIGKPDEHVTHPVSRRMKFVWIGDNDQPHRNEPLNSFAFYQFFYSGWIPCKPTVLHPFEWIAPNCAYMPAEHMDGGKFLPGLLPHLPKFGQDPGYEYRQFLAQDLHIRSSLPHSSDEIWPEWYSALGSAAAQGKQLNKYRDGIKKLVQYSLSGYSKPGWTDKVRNIPCRVISSDGKDEEIAFHPKNTVCWIDKPYLSDPHARVILLKRFNIFLFDDLSTGKRSETCFGTSPLSQKVHAVAEAGNVHPEAETEIKKQYRSRLAALRMNQSIYKKFPLPNDLKIKVVDDLQLKLLHDEEILTEYGILHWTDTDGCILIVSRNQYRALGAALAEPYGIAAEIIELYLTEKTIDGIRDRLRDKGYSLDDLDDIEQEIRAEENEARGGTEQPEEDREDRGQEEDREVEPTVTRDPGKATGTSPIITPKDTKTPEPKIEINKYGVGAGFPKRPNLPDVDPKTKYTPTFPRGNALKRHHRLISYVIHGENGAEPNENNSDKNEKVARDRETDLCAIRKVIGELSAEYEVTEMPHGNPGYDLIAVNRTHPTRKLYIEVKGTGSEWNETGVGMSREQYNFARHMDPQEGEFWLFVVENARNPEIAKTWRIKNPPVQVDYYQFDHGWKDIDQQETIKPTEGMSVVYGRQRGTISEVKERGPFTLLTIVYEDGETATLPYKPNEMVLETNPIRSTDDGCNPTHSE